MVKVTIACKVRAGPTPGFQPLGELRDRPGKPKGITGSQHFYSRVLMFKQTNRKLYLTYRMVPCLVTLTDL